MNTFRFPDELKESFKYSIQKAKEDRPRYFEWIKNEIEIAISLVNKFDKKYILGGLGARLLKSTPNFYNQFLDGYSGSDSSEIHEDEKLQEDDEIEVLLEYALSLATASPNDSVDIPKQVDIDKFYDQLSKIKSNINFWELSADIPTDGNEFDHWLRTNVMQDSINVRGDGFHIHVKEVYQEIFKPHNGFLDQYYGFNAIDVFETIEKLENLVYSKVGNPLGAIQSHKRLTDWMEEVGEDNVMQEMMKTGKHFIRQFTEANPDLYSESAPDHVTSYHLDNIAGYTKLFWVIPKTEKEKRIFERLAIQFGDNAKFLQPPKFKAFPLNDSLVGEKILIKEDGKFFLFSTSLGFRSIFKIADALIKNADAVYYDTKFKGNSLNTSKDNYIEQKTKSLFEKLIPSGQFYHSLDYEVVEDGLTKKTELDILGLSGDTAYIIEVKAGELNAKHKRGAMKGLKDRLSETINEGSYQCHRALKYIEENEAPTFEYVQDNTRKTLTINKASISRYFKISVTFEHYASIASNLKYLINTGVLSPDFKWTWIVSMYDLMIFSDLIENESDFKEYLDYRIKLYERDDVEFSDEIDILGYYFEGMFPLSAEKKNEKIMILDYKSDIDNYYTKLGVGMPQVKKPKKK